MCNFDPLEIVGRVSEAQLQVGENLNKIKWKISYFISDIYVK